MKRLKTFDQHKKEKTITKSDDVMVKPTEKKAADTFTADEMDGISAVGDVVEVPTPQPED